MKKITLILTAAAAIGLAAGCCKQTQKSGQLKQHPSQDKNASVPAEKKTNQDKLINGPLGTTGRDAQNK